jgi:hypothetical protein
MSFVINKEKEAEIETQKKLLETTTTNLQVLTKQENEEWQKFSNAVYELRKNKIPDYYIEIEGTHFERVFEEDDYIIGADYSDGIIIIKEEIIKTRKMNKLWYFLDVEKLEEKEIKKKILMIKFSNHHYTNGISSIFINYSYISKIEELFIKINEKLLETLKEKVYKNENELEFRKLNPVSFN